MKLEKLSRLIASVSLNSQSTQQTEQSEEQAAQVENQSNEAVRVAQDFGASHELNPELRRKKVAEIKAQVAEGTYRRDSIAVAEAVARELLV